MVNKMNGESLDVTAQNIARLKELFPEILTDGDKIDFDMLKAVLGEVVDTEQERYQFTWNGKKKMIEGTQKPSKGTLRPIPEKSKNFDTTENLYIEGDNLEVLKLLQKSYNGKIKMIYIDPPYNTGKDFVYKDNFKDGVQNYLEQTGQVDVDGNVLSTNTESNGRFHTDWLNMMFARLKLAKSLLKEDGVICISIGDHEVMNLRKICDEIFGENNFEGHIHWRRRTNQPNDVTKLIGLVAEHILVYAKNSVYLKSVGVGKVDVTANFSNPDNDPLGEWASKPWKVGSGQNGSKYAITYPNGNVVEGEWMGSEETYKNLLSSNRIYFPNNGNGEPRKKYYKFERDEEGQCATNWWGADQFGSNQEGSKHLADLLGEKNIFDNPKPIRLLRGLIQIANVKDGDICLDFFSGSGSFAEAVMQMNSEDDINRKYIVIQIPEDLDKSLKSAKGKSKKTIENAINFLDEINKPHFLTEIGLERIRRAGEKIKAELKEKQQKVGMLDENTVNPDSLDIGFKVLKLDTSNIREWNADFENLEDELDLYETPFIDGRSELDIVYEIMLKQGLELTYPIEMFEVNDKEVYDIAFGSLFICLSKEITTDIAKAIIARRDEHGTETSSVIFSDAGFSNDSDKLNCIEILKDAGYPEDNLLTI